MNRNNGLSEIHQSSWHCSHNHSGNEHPKCWERFVATFGNERVGFLDIESSNLQGDFGFMFSWALKEYNGQVYGDCLKKRDFQNGLGMDKRIIKSLIEILPTFDRIITFYGTYFDVPFCRTRALDVGVKFPFSRQLRHTDVWFIARSKLKLHSNRLESVADFLRVKEKYGLSKTKLEPRIWRKAAFGDETSLKLIYKHNIKDVEVLEKVYEELLPYFTDTRRSI